MSERESFWQERPSKRARTRLAETMAPSEERRSSIVLLNGDFTTLSSGGVEEVGTTTKRRLPSGEPDTPKKMKFSLEDGAGDVGTPPFDPYMTSPLSPYSLTSSLYMPAAGVSNYETIFLPEDSVGEELAHLQRNPNVLFKTRATSLHGARLSPYNSQITAHQRRADRRRRDAESDTQEIHGNSGVWHGSYQENAPNLDNQGEGGLRAQSTPSGGARPKERPQKTKADLVRDSINKDLDALDALLGIGKKTESELDESSPKASDHSVERNVNECETKTQRQGCLAPDRDAPEEVHSKGHGSDMAGDKQFEKLRNDYSDSMEIVKSLLDANDQYANQVQKLVAETSALEARLKKDELERASLHSILETLGKRYSDKISNMSTRIELLESRHGDDQMTIGQQRVQVELLTSQLEQVTVTSREQHEQLLLMEVSTQHQLEEQQQALDSCRARLENLCAGVARQRECLECSICLGVFTAPVTLGCGHTFCGDCIESNRRSAVLPDSCPLCRQLITTAVGSSVISQLAEITQGLEIFHV
ncbi:E3 ubiquitin-protein ligase rnf8-A-like [Amphibalanus amphitrite]|uniref:E3 ubiquitin-protein ligase rnf8-A-like n=1 Tax=Amphibalanus amphitrite TaxID=1232801 RepID=UPI001C90BD93|nr:E3 ubiquitin-protein ligase rnf8-A-like [Amphibalanus amphitrite]